MLHWEFHYSAGGFSPFYNTIHSHQSLLFTCLFPGLADTNMTQMYCHFTVGLYLPTPLKYISSTAWRKLVNLRFVLSKDIRLQIVLMASVQSSPQKLKNSQKINFNSVAASKHTLFFQTRPLFEACLLRFVGLVHQWVFILLHLYSPQHRARARFDTWCLLLSRSLTLVLPSCRATSSPCPHTPPLQHGCLLPPNLKHIRINPAIPISSGTL